VSGIGSSRGICTSASLPNHTRPLHPLVIEMQTSNAESAEPHDHAPGSSRSLQHSKSQHSSNALSASEDQEHCKRFCPCQCHAYTQLQTPHWLRHIVGSLVGYTNFTFMLTRRSCNYGACLRSGVVALRLSYFAPFWATMHALSFQVVSGGVGGPQATIRPVRVIPRDAAVWPVVQCGATDKLRRLLESGEFSPSDILDDGTSLLHVRLRFGAQVLVLRLTNLQYAGMNGRADMCVYLVQNSADKYFRNSHGM
jgi:hypothetical protein